MNKPDLHHQFLIYTGERPRIDGWKESSCNGTGIQHHPLLPVHDIVDAEGNCIGKIIGWSVTESGSLISETQRWPITEEFSQEQIESCIYSHGGRFIVLLVTPQFRRIYLDPGGMLSMVYARDGDLAGSTITALAWDNPNHPIWRGQPDYLPQSRPNQYLPAGLTADPKISRLLPNHYLDLVTWKPVRHYPNNHCEPLSETNADEGYRECADIVERHINAFAQHYKPLYITLTAGSDSRVMLACAKQAIERIEFITFDLRSRKKYRTESYADFIIARQITAKFGINHRILGVERPSRELKNEYLLRIGYAGNAGKARNFLSACRQHLDLKGAWATGHAGAVGSGYYWRGIRSDSEHLDATLLLKRLGLPLAPRFISAMEQWLADFPAEPATTVLDYLFIEQRVGCWAGPHQYGTAPFAAIFCPFNHRDLFDLAHSLKRVHLRKNDLCRGIVPLVWPALNNLPINNYPGPLGWASQSESALKALAKKGLRVLRIS